MLGLMQSAPPTRSGVISRGVSTSGSSGAAAEGVNEHDNIKVTPICKVIKLTYMCAERRHPKERYRHIDCEEIILPVQAGPHGAGNRCVTCGMMQVAVRLRPLNGREVAGGDTEAVTVTPEDPHSLQVQDCFSRFS